MTQTLECIAELYLFCHTVFAEFELPLVITFAECWAVWMFVFQVVVMLLWICCCAATFFTDIHLGSTFFVGKREFDIVDLTHVRFQGASLGECFIAVVTLVWTNT